MNPLTKNRMLLHSNLKVRRLEADTERMADVLAMIAVFAECDPSPFTPEEALTEIARLARAALVSATPPDPRLAVPET